MRWIIGDVHGMLRPLETVIKEINRTDSSAVLYFTGDYVNRGPDSRGVIDLLLNLDNAKFIRGNHDDVLDQILHGKGYADNPSNGDRFLIFQWFLQHGLLETLRNYGVSDAQIGTVITQRKPESFQPIIDLFPIDHRLFIHSLPVFIEDDDLFVIHGCWPLREKNGPREVLTRPSPKVRHSILWERFTDADLHRPKAWPKTGYFGHTPAPTYTEHADNYTPIVTQKMILIDTSAFMPVGRLSAICAETSQIIQAHHDGKLCTELCPAKTVPTS